MLKLDPKLIFWSLAVHRYPKQHSLKTSFATRAGGETLHIDENFIAKKMKISKF